MARRDESWLSLTPEPERLLPAARAVLRTGAAEPPAHVLAAEQALAERLVVRARRAGWDAWLRESEALAAGPATDGDGPTAAASALVRDVVANYDALALGLPGRERFKSGGR
jgi:hypothetical protein